VLRVTFGLKRDEILGDWKELHNEELHNFHSLGEVIRMIKSRRKKRAGHTLRMGRRKMHVKIFVEKP
jgi:hypothetical protein